MENWKKVMLTISTIVIVVLMAVLGVTIFSAINKNSNNSIDVAQNSEKEIVNANVSINTEFGDSVVTGEIIIGGTSTSGAHAYYDGAYKNGYCLCKGATLVGTFSSGQTLKNSGSAYTSNNAKSGCSGQIQWLLDNMMRLNLTMTNGTNVLDPEYNLYKENLKNILSKNGKDSKILNNMKDKDIFQVQQYALWNYTKNGPNRDQGSVTPSWKNNTSDAKAILYDALIKEADNNSSYKSDGKGNKITVSQNSDSKMYNDTASTNGGVKITSLSINNPSGKYYYFSYDDFKIVYNGKTETVKAENVTVFTSTSKKLTNGSYTNYSGEIFVKLYGCTLKDNVKYTATGIITATEYSTTATYWSNGNLQPVVTLQRKDVPHNLKVAVQYEKISGAYQLKIEKIDGDGKSVNIDNNTSFNVKIEGKDYSSKGTKSGNIISYPKVNITNTNDAVIEIKEDSAPKGYNKYDKTIKLTVKKTITNGSYIGTLWNGKIEIGGKEYAKTDNNWYDNNQVQILWGEGIITVKIKNIKDKKVDLALKKVITKATKNGSLVEVKDNGFNVNRGITTNIKSLSTSTNATYSMIKTPLEVSKGDKIEYQLQVYNEGEVDAKALQIEDYIPKGLKVTKVFYNQQELPQQTDGFDCFTITGSKWQSSNNYYYDYNSGMLNITLGSANLIPAFNGTTLSKDHVTVQCQVENDAVGILTNVAEIRRYAISTGNIDTDVDSIRNNWRSPNSDEYNDQKDGGKRDIGKTDKSTTAWRNYKKGTGSVTDGSAHDTFTGSKYNKTTGQEDDDDFEKIIVRPSYEFVIKKVNASSNNSGINDVKFNIKRVSSKGTENFDNVATTNSQISYKDEVSNYGKSTIKYTITEIPNNNYVQLNKPINLELVVEKGKITGYKFSYGTTAYGGVQTQTKEFTCKSAEGIELKVKVNFSSSRISVEIGNKVINPSQYGVRFKKVSSGNNSALQGVTFTGKYASYKNGEASSAEYTDITLNATDENGFTNTITNPINFDTYSKIDEYCINEVDLGANSGYSKLDADIKVLVHKKITKNDIFVLDYYEVKVGDKTVKISDTNVSDNIAVEENGVRYVVTAQKSTISNVNTLTVTVTNAPDVKIPLQIRKVAKEDNSTITNAQYTIYKEGILTPLYRNIDLTGTVNLTDNIEAGNSEIIYKVVEENAPEGYDNIFVNKFIEVTVNVENSIPTTAQAKVVDKNGVEDIALSAEVEVNIIDIDSVKTIDLQIKNPRTEKVVDLALKKIITEVNGVKTTTASGINSVYDRLTPGDSNFRIDTQPLKNGGTNANYYLNKTPILVQKGSTIKYEIRIYNEGEENATASKITDYLPNGLKFVNAYYRNETAPLTKNSDYTYDEAKNVLKINTLANKELINKYDDGDVLSYDYITVECRVDSVAKGILTNVAEISQYKTADGIIDEDRDSQIANWVNPVDNNKDNNEIVDRNSDKWVDYAGNYNNTIEEGVYKNYKGQQDDDDFEKIVVGEIDLVLKKIITHVNDASVDTLDGRFHRFQEGKINVNTELFNKDLNTTTAEYYLNKTPIQVKINDTITYQIRIYNEGSIDATASQITDYIPKGLDLVSVEYKGRILNAEEDYSIKNNVLIIKAMKNSLINKYGGDSFNNVEPEFDFVTVKCRTNGSVRGLLTNVAEISKYQTAYEETNVDRDSQTVGDGEWTSLPGSNKLTLDGKSGVAWARYYDNIKTAQFLDYVGQQDDDDFEKILVTTGYTLQLQKISALDNSMGVEGIDISVNNNKYTTDANGYIEKLGPFDLTVSLGYGELDAYAISEVPKDDGNYVKLKQPFYIFVYKKIANDGTSELYGYYINTVTNRPEADAVFNNLTYDTATYYTRDENDNIIKIIISVKEDELNVGNYNIDIKLENKIVNSTYDLSISKVDENGSHIDGVEFDCYVDTHEISMYKKLVTVDGKAFVGVFKMAEDSVEKQDTFTFTEIEAPERYFVLEDTLKLVVNKGLNTNKDAYEVKSIKLVNGNEQTNEAQEVVLENVKLKGTNKTVSVIAKLEENSITLTVTNVEKKFDLALRKFITGVNGNKLGKDESREPIVDCSKLKSGEATTAEYNHTKSAKLVSPRDIVEYNLRIYNEGEIDGFAELVMDDIPDGVEMVAPAYDENGNPANLNAEFRWVMYKKYVEADNSNDENNTNKPNIIIYDDVKYVETTDVKEAKLIVTDYLSKANGEAMLRAEGATDIQISEQSVTNPNLIKAFDYDEGTFTKENYRDIKVEFKVKATNEENKEIINYAQITEHSDGNGSSVVDRDSTPNKWEKSPRDDDQDIEKIKVRYFDLALYKWVTTAVVTENGKTTEYESKHTQDDKSKMVDVSIPKDKLDKVTVKFKYKIKVENQGQLAGYAKEIKDHIPQGLKFVAEDNIEYGWVLEDDNTITTDYLKDTLLQPNETAEVTVVLTWINSASNLNAKVNFAEISEDDNEYGAPDIDSTPNNFTGKSVEDDEDDDVVMLQVRTGITNSVIYSVVAVIALGIVAIGVFGIKKFVR